jgi:hypothetical protein
MAEARYRLEFYKDQTGDEPVRRWLREELTARQRRAIGYAMAEVLEHLGIGVCSTEFGKQLGGGLFEFRLRRDLAALAVGQETTEPGAHSERILLRVFCHAYGDRIVLLLAGYDKGRDPSPGRQQAEITVARKRLKSWLANQRGG